MKHWIQVFVTILLSCVGHAQESLTVDAAVKGIAYEPNLVLPGSAPTGSQVARFNLIFNPEPVSGYHLDRLIWELEVGSTIEPGTAILSSGKYLIASPSSLSAEAVFVNAAYRGKVKCTAVYKNISNTLSYVSTRSRTVASVGGPLKISRKYGDTIYAPERDSQAHPDDVGWYLQWLGHRRSEIITYEEQSPQGVVIQPRFLQPSGTTISWSGSDKLDLELKGSGNSVEAFANQASTTFADLQVTATYEYIDPSDTSTSLTVTDNSSSTPPDGTSALNSKVYKFTAHSPKAVYNGGVVNVSYETGPAYFSYSRTINMYLTDQFNGKMPGVWVQEEIPNLAEELTRRLAESPPALVFWTTNWIRSVVDGVETYSPAYFGVDQAGWTKAGDTLFLRLPFEHAFFGNQTDPWFNFTHQYWAGVKSTGLTASAIKVGEFRDKMWTTAQIRETIYP